MRAGGQKVRVQVWRAVQSGTGGYGHPVTTDELWKETWAEMKPRRGNEHVSANELFALTHWYFTFRYYSVKGIAADNWLVVDGQRYDIRNIVPDYQRKNDCVVEARVANINTGGDSAALEIALQTALPDGEIGEPYLGSAPAVTGGTPPYTFTADGELPAGLVIADTTGVISGTPTGAGTKQFDIVATDAAGKSAALPVSITIEA